MRLNDDGIINLGLRNILVTIIIALGLLFIWEIRGTLMLTFAAVILVVLFTMPVRLLMQRFKMNRFLSILLSVIGFFVILTLMALLVFPTIGAQFSTLATETVPNGIEQLQASITRENLIAWFPFLEGVITGDSTELINQVISQVSDALGRLGGTILPVVGGVANTILSVLIIFFLSMYLLAEPELYVNGIIRLTPKWYRARMQIILQRVDSTLRVWHPHWF